MADARGIVRKVPLFAALSDEDADAVLRVLKARQGRPGDTLFHEGDPGDTLMIVVEGRLDASVTTPDGSQAKVATIEPGQVVGELAFLDAGPRSATVSTKSGATVLEFSRRALLVLCRDQPRIGAILQRNVLADLARRVRARSKVRWARPRAPARVWRRRRARRGESAARPATAARRAVTAAQLRAIPVLANHSAEDLDLLAYAGALRGFARGDVLMCEGDEGDAAYLLLSGALRVTREGSSATVATLEPGALVGQLALLDRAPRSATVSAVDDCSALELNANVFANLVNASSPLALRFQRDIATVAARHLRTANTRFAASAGPSSQRTLHEMDGEDIPSDWSSGSDEAIELGVDLESLRR